VDVDKETPDNGGMIVWFALVVIVAGQGACRKSDGIAAFGIAALVLALLEVTQTHHRHML
jgi:hypothetical protein